MNQRLATGATDEVDGLLTQFFQAAMPEPWPDCPQTLSEAVAIAPRPLSKHRLNRWPGRLAVAAAVGGLVIGYLGLQSWFPEPRPASSLGISVKPLMALKPGPFTDRTLSGRPVSGEVQLTPVPKQFVIRVEEIPTDK